MLSLKRSRLFSVLLFVLSFSHLIPASKASETVPSGMSAMLTTAQEAARQLAPSAVLLRAVGTRNGTSDCVEGKEWDFQFLDPSQSLENGHRLGYSIRFRIDPAQCDVATLVLPQKPRLVSRDRLDWNREVPGLGETRHFNPSKILSISNVQKAIQSARSQSEWTHAILRNREGGLKPHGITFEVISNEGMERQNQAFIEAYTGQVQGVWDYDPYNR